MDIRIKGPIDGVEIARELRERRRPIRRNFFWAWIVKPLSPAVIARTLRDVVDG